MVFVGALSSLFLCEVYKSLDAKSVVQASRAKVEGDKPSFRSKKID